MKQNTAQAEKIQTYSPKEAAKLLGVSAETVRRALRETGERRLPAAKINARYVISLADLQAWYRSHGGHSLV